jgi:hypothetical protein
LFTGPVPTQYADNQPQGNAGDARYGGENKLVDVWFHITSLKQRACAALPYFLRLT